MKRHTLKSYAGPAIAWRPQMSAGCCAALFAIVALCGVLSTMPVQAAEQTGTQVAQAQGELQPRYRFSNDTVTFGPASRPTQSSDTPSSNAPRQQTPAPAPAPNQVAPDPASAQSMPAPTTPAQPGATPEGFALGQGDVIGFSIVGQPDMKTSAFLSPEGTVALPLIGEVKLGGLNPVQAQKVVADAYIEGGYFRNPQVNITIEEFRSRQVSVLGSVNRPGRYALKTRTTVLDMLAEAEGINQAGSNIVTVIRKTDAGEQRFNIDVNDLVQSPGQLQSFQLDAGDIVYVPEAEKFYIYGEVRRPDQYKFKPGMTVMQAISRGGGVTERGSNSRVEVRRTSADGETETYKADLTDTIQPDDVIFVKERFF
jgi:polysaccharide export outer membrane protein